MYSSARLPLVQGLSLEGVCVVGGEDFHHQHHGGQSISLDGTIFSGDANACVMLTSDPKPRLRWTTELHERFVDSVTQLGGPDKATPKTILRTMGVKGLTLYHLKSHLQKFRLGKLSCKEATENSRDSSCMVESQDPGSPTSGSSKVIAQDLNDGHQVTEALRVQMEVQRRLHEQLEVQRHLQIRIESQGKYLQSILDKACKILSFDQDPGETRETLSESDIKVSPIENRNTSNNHPAPLITDCSIDDSCLTSNESPVAVAVAAAAALKKRQRPLFRNNQSLPLDNSNMTQIEWMMSNIR